MFPYPWGKKSKCNFFSKKIQYLGHILGATGICLLPCKTWAIQHMTPPTTPKQVRAFLRLVGYYRKFIRGFAKKVKTAHITHQAADKIQMDTGTPSSFYTSEGCHCSGTYFTLPKPQQNLHHIHWCLWWCLQSAALPGTWWNWVSRIILSHTLSETQHKWSTTQQEAFGVYYAITKWNYYLQGANIIVRNDHKPLARFLNGKNVNNKVNRWSLELATYNITFKWISGAKNKALG